MKKYKKKKKNLLNYILYILLIGFICAITFIYYFNKTLGPGLIECAENEIRRLTSIVMNNSIQKYLSQNNLDNLFQISRNNSNEIERIQYNTKELNKTSFAIADILETDLQYMVNGNFEKLNLNLNTIPDNYYEKLNDGILFTVSIGSASGNRLLANIGPKIPLNLNVIGEVYANIATKVTEYGMNNAMIEVYVELEATTVIHMPFLSKQINVKNKIPLTMEIIQGNIPSYTFNN